MSDGVTQVGYALNASPEGKDDPIPLLSMEPQPLPAALNPNSVLVKPGSPVKLKNFDPSFTGDLKKKAAKDLL